MRLKLMLTILIGIISYVLTVLYNLLQGIPLNLVLWRGLTALVLAGAVTFVLVLLLEWLGEDELPGGDMAEDLTGTDDVSSSQAEDSELDQGKDNENDFSPLDPPVLEIDEEESD